MKPSLLIVVLVFAGWRCVAADESLAKVPAKPLLGISQAEAKLMILDFLSNVPWKEIPADRIDRRADVAKANVRTLLDGQIYVIGRWLVDRRDHRISLKGEKTSPFLFLNGEITVEEGKYRIVKVDMIICARPVR